MSTTVDSHPRWAPRFTSRQHDDENAAWLGIALGVAFTVCFVTGVVSHLIQDPGSWFHWPARPAGLYRVNQGLHVTTGVVAVPLLIVKLWVVFPKLFEWPPFRSVAQAVERLALVPLVGGAVFLLVTGVGNVNIWRPYDFSFRTGHYAAAWIVMGALVVHVAAKWAVTRDVVAARLRGQSPPASTEAAPAVEGERPGGLSRRAFLGTTAAASGALALFTVGQTFAPLRSLALLAPRRPDSGPQGFPVNRTAESVGLTDVDLADYRLEVVGDGVATPLSLTYDDLAAMPQHEATLPIACVEGWSTNQRWQGVRVRDLLERAGARSGAEATVVALHDNPRQRTSELSSGQASDPDTLLALRVNDEVLVADHGFPARLIGPNRPGVHQTKWVARLEVR
ncbi:MAG: molybdopterin-dependent oxidoreductase [Acidimicrobiales bacterium]|nr:molybdopterin-dependent oxidoreductase [Acidimicrobiales bacterium]MCB9374027.1 molybdopterin-dependent oxidoreductase [Microthrixaceae bacterium]